MSNCQSASRPELSIASARVDPYGYIAYPYLGQVSVKDLTAQEVADRVCAYHRCPHEPHLTLPDPFQDKAS